MGRKRVEQSADRTPYPGRGRPTSRQLTREERGRGEDMLFPEGGGYPTPDTPGTLICARCHAISLEKRWFLNEPLYEALKAKPDTQAVICPGCLAVEREQYDGEVILRGRFLASRKQEALNLIHNVEASLRADNPLARLASVQDRGEEIYILTITPFLAQRIGKEFEKAYDGKLEIQNLQGERFSRVRWSRE